MNFLHPRYWLIWIFYGLLRLISYLPYGIQMCLGRMLGRVLLHLSPKRRKIAETNLRLCFPDWSGEKRRETLKKHFESLGMCLFEFGITWWWPDERFRPLAKIEGLENLENALKKGKGVILLVGHFTTLDVIGHVLKLHADFHPMYRKNNNPLIDHIITSGRLRHCSKLIPHDDLRAMIRSLRSNKTVAYIPDQNFGRKHSIFVPFFGLQAATVPATSRLAAIDNTPVLPLIQQRLPHNQGYRVIIEKELDNFPTDNLEQDTTRVNQIFEQQVRNNPVDYLWVHRRFKTRPEGEKSFYVD